MMQGVVISNDAYIEVHWEIVYFVLTWYLQIEIATFEYTLFMAWGDNWLSSFHIKGSFRTIKLHIMKLTTLLNIYRMI